MTETRPQPKFPCTSDGQPMVVRVPRAVCESMQAVIVGREWAPDNNQLRKKAAGWMYRLVEANKDRLLGNDFFATEEELVEWMGA